jgi:uncharacterized protein YlxP (DUF503 family)
VVLGVESETLTFPSFSEIFDEKTQKFHTSFSKHGTMQLANFMNLSVIITSYSERGETEKIDNILNNIEKREELPEIS